MFQGVVKEGSEAGMESVLFGGGSFGVTGTAGKMRWGSGRSIAAGVASHGKGNPAALEVDGKHAHGNALPDLDDIGGVCRKGVAQFGDMDETVLMDADIDEGAEIGDIRDDAGEFHSGVQVFEDMNTFCESKHLELFTGIPSGLCQFGDDIAEGWETDGIGAVFGKRE